MLIRKSVRPTSRILTSLLRCALTCLAAGLAASAVQAGTLEEVRARDRVLCGVSLGLPGFSVQEPDGSWTGLDVDTCRAVAAAVLGDADKVAYVALSANDRFDALHSGQIDLLARNTTWTLSRDAGLELEFAGVTYYDGQGFMTRNELGLERARELDGAVVCLTVGTTTELNLANFLESNGIQMRASGFEGHAEAAAAYEQGRCDAMTGDHSALAAFRSEFKHPEAHDILPDIISKEPLGPAVRQNDDEWFDIVKWTVFALIQAEESSVTSENVDGMKASQDPTVQRLLGSAGGTGQQMGLTDDWAYQVVKQVGSYGEVYDRNVGPSTPLGLVRGLNALWTDGGLMYAMPFR